MNITYEKKDAMTFIGYHTEIRPEEGYQKCPEFWDKEYNARYKVAADDPLSFVAMALDRRHCTD